MYYYFLEHEILIFAGILVPVLGWMIKFYISKKAVKVILIVSIIMLLPVLFGYSYVEDYLNLIALFVMLAAIYSFGKKSQHRDLKSTLQFSAVLAIILTIFLFFLNFLGEIEITDEWRLGRFNVKHVSERGFSGGPLLTYQLYEYSKIPIFVKHVEEKVDSDTTYNCKIKFAYHNLSFDKCAADANNDGIQLYIPINR